MTLKLFKEQESLYVTECLNRDINGELNETMKRESKLRKILGQKQVDGKHNLGIRAEKTGYRRNT